MTSSSKSAGLLAALLSAVSFSTSGAFIKPLLEAGWSPVAAVTARALTAGLVLLPFVLLALRGKWSTLWRGRWRVLGMGLVGVAFTQATYFAAIQRIPVSTALLVEYLAPLLLVALAWMTTRRRPGLVVLLGSALAVGGLILVIGPGALQVVDGVGLLIAFCAAVGCAAYFVIAARPADGLPPVALAGSGLLLAGVVLALIGATGLLPTETTFTDVTLFDAVVPWWTPLLIVAVIGTAVAYATGIVASGILGSRLASFIGMLEVVSASLFAWLLLGESLTLVQLLGGALILGGIAAVRSAPAEEPPAAVATSAGEPRTAGPAPVDPVEQSAYRQPGPTGRPVADRT